MNVIGIVQTDLNEFDILFEPEQSNQNNGQGGQSGDQSGQQQSNNQQDQDGNAPDFFSLLMGSGGDQNPDNSGQNGGQGQQQGPQEMTVRIKGVPEGQKATFLQMYQIIQDAKASQELEQKCTVVSKGDGQSQGPGQGGGQGYGQGKKPDKQGQGKSQNQTSMYQ